MPRRNRPSRRRWDGFRPAGEVISEEPTPRELAVELVQTGRAPIEILLDGRGMSRRLHRDLFPEEAL